MAERCDAAALDRERRLWEAYRSGSRERLDALIDPAALDVGPAGVLDRERVVEAVGRMRIERYALSELRVRRLGEIEIVSYRCEIEGTYDGRPFPFPRSYATTVWRREERAWRVVHRHETPARDRQ